MRNELSTPHKTPKVLEGRGYEKCPLRNGPTLNQAPFFATLARSPSLTFLDVSALGGVDFPQRSSVKTIRECLISCLSLI